jgi:hypothetical protein
MLRIRGRKTEAQQMTKGKNMIGESGGAWSLYV